jgi:phospholipase A1
MVSLLKITWQIYNTALSRPFREVNYEPELIFKFPVKFNLFGFKTRMVGVALNHKSAFPAGLAHVLCST